MIILAAVSTAVSSLSLAPAKAVTSMTGQGEEHHTWFYPEPFPPVAATGGGGNGTTRMPCVQYRTSTVRGVFTGGVFEVPTSGTPIKYPASSTSPIIVTVTIVNNGGAGGTLHFEGPDGTYSAYTPGSGLLDGGCTPFMSPYAGTPIPTDAGTTPVPTVTKGTNLGANLCQSPTAVSIQRGNAYSPTHQVRTVTFTCKDSTAAAATTYTLTGTGLQVTPGTYVDPPCNPSLASLDCALSDVRLS